MVEVTPGEIGEWIVCSSDNGVDDSILLAIENPEYKTDVPLISCPGKKDSDEAVFGEQVE